MADYQIYHFQLFLLISFCFIFSSYAFQFKVGGSQGWVANPYENYNTWAERMRFQVNDTLFFKYSKGDSVLVVNKDDYDKCYTDKPIMKFDDGRTVFKFDRSGPFYFIGGNKSNCEKGQKMSIVILAVRNSSPLPTPPGQSPTASPPTGTSPVSPSPYGGSITPALSPPPALSPSSPSPQLTPAPAGSPTSPSPANVSPSLSPKGLTPAPTVSPTNSSPLPSSVSSPPSPLSPSTTPGSPGVSPSGGGGGISGAPTSGPSGIHSPTGSPPGSSATPAFTPAAVLISTVSFVMPGLVIFM